ncbi:MAG: sugar transporter [Muribaculaceae bacterium]|nr:sugar transporter [Muribaculaceae bacterium]
MTLESRTSKSLHNSIVALIFYVINFFLSFFSRKIFLDYLGTEILGLNTTAVNLLQFLNLAELGIANAVGFSLYKPLHEKDHDTVNEIVSLQGHLYKRIAILILIGGFILMAFFPLIFKKIHLPLWYAYASFGVLLFSALLGYFFNYKQIVLSANQQNYKILYSFRTIMIAKTLLQMWAVYRLNNGYVWWLIIEGIFAIIGSWSLHKATIKEFPGLTKVKSTFKSLRTKHAILVTKIKQIFFHKIGSFALNQSSPLIIYAFTTLTTVALYGNYITIVNGVQMLIGAVFDSMGAGVGNLVAEGDQQKIRNVFDELFSIRFLIVSTIVFCVFFLSPSFIKIWIGAEYILPTSTLLIICGNMFIQLHRYTVEIFVNAYGLYSDILAPIIEATLNIGLSIGLGFAWGLNGVLLGVMISQILVIMMWKPYYLMTRKMKGFLSHFIILSLKHFFVFAIMAFVCIFFLRNFTVYASQNYGTFLLGSIPIVATFALGSWILLFILNPGMREVSSRLLKLIPKNK